jgi:hypothetical protein
MGPPSPVECCSAFDCSSNEICAFSLDINKFYDNGLALCSPDTNTCSYPGAGVVDCCAALDCRDFGPFGSTDKECNVLGECDYSCALGYNDCNNDLSYCDTYVPNSCDGCETLGECTAVCSELQCRDNTCSYYQSCWPEIGTCETGYCCAGPCILPNCVDIDGTVCNDPNICSVDLITTHDTSYCCPSNGLCEAPTCTVSNVGERKCIQGDVHICDSSDGIYSWTEFQECIKDEDCINNNDKDYCKASSGFGPCRDSDLGILKNREDHFIRMRGDCVDNFDVYFDECANEDTVTEYFCGFEEGRNKCIPFEYDCPDGSSCVDSDGRCVDETTVGTPFWHEINPIVGLKSEAFVFKVENLKDPDGIKNVYAEIVPYNNPLESFTTKMSKSHGKEGPYYYLLLANPGSQDVTSQYLNVGFHASNVDIEDKKGEFTSFENVDFFEVIECDDSQNPCNQELGPKVCCNGACENILTIAFVPLNMNQADPEFLEAVEFNKNKILQEFPISDCNGEKKLDVITTLSCQVSDPSEVHICELTKELRSCMEGLDMIFNKRFIIFVGLVDVGEGLHGGCVNSHLGHYVVSSLPHNEDTAVIHELAHSFGLKDEYCDCERPIDDVGECYSIARSKDAFCGPTAWPNPLDPLLGCDVEAQEGEPNYCCQQRGVYSTSCYGNFDINGERSAMSNGFGTFTTTSFPYLISEFRHRGY